MARAGKRVCCVNLSDAIAWFHAIRDFVGLILESPRSLTERILRNVIGVLVSLIENPGLNFGMLSFYGDESFFELVGSVIVTIGQTDFLNDVKFRCKVIKFFHSCIGAFPPSTLSPEHWECFLTAVSLGLAQMTIPTMRLIVESFEIVISQAPMFLKEMPEAPVLAFVDSFFNFLRTMIWRNCVPFVITIFRVFPDGILSRYSDVPAAELLLSVVESEVSLPHELIVHAIESFVEFRLSEEISAD
jgi:hypothetical protein